MIVICLEGSHGSGKSTLCAEFEARGWPVLDEAFMDMPEVSLHPQSLVMETVWMCNWFTRLLKMQKELEKEGGEEKVFLADRSPYSAVFYAKKGRGRLLEPVIRAHVEELKEANIHIYTVYIKVERNLLWKRIQARLEDEPHREKFGEKSMSWMDTTVTFYDTCVWDFTLHNGEGPMSGLRDSLVRLLTDGVPRFTPPTSPLDTDTDFPSTPPTPGTTTPERLKSVQARTPGSPLLLV